MARNENIPASPSIDEPIDMIAYARETTRRDVQRVAPGSIKLIAPAKVNLFLGVGELRPDGFHDVRTALHALMLHDVLYMNLEPRAEDGGADSASALVAAEAPDPADSPLRISVQCVGFEGVAVPDIAAHENIAYRAVRALADELGRMAAEHMAIRIEKHIPHQAGLGGGSADAAAALVGAARLWGLPEDDGTRELLARVASRLGSDVAFFLQGGCAYYTGRGEVLEHALQPRKDHVVLIKPEGGLSTAAVYREFDAAHEPATDAQLAELGVARDACDVALFNNMAAPAERLMPELAYVREWAAAQPGVGSVMLSGSGAATFALCDGFDAACKLAAAAKLKGWWARTTSLCGARAAVVGS